MIITFFSCIVIWYSCIVCSCVVEANMNIAVLNWWQANIVSSFRRNNSYRHSPTTCSTATRWRHDMEMLSALLAITVTSWWVRWRLKPPASRLFTQPFIRAQIIENIKAPCHWLLCGEFTGNRWIPRTKGQERGKCFHLMTSSCVCLGDPPITGGFTTQGPIMQTFDISSVVCPNNCRSVEFPVFEMLAIRVTSVITC